MVLMYHNSTQLFLFARKIDTLMERGRLVSCGSWFGTLWKKAEEWHENEILQDLCALWERDLGGGF